MKVWLVKPVKHDLSSRSPISRTEMLSSKTLPDTRYYMEFYRIPVSGSGTFLEITRVL